jgi:predicted unusual protein kinase regulating ubiquinone biosynthesis (AarF/ABC1/UbiB family)
LLGQVHRGRGLDGQALVLKIQYLGIAAICNYSIDHCSAW